jgi:hypothetical protein
MDIALGERSFLWPGVTFAACSENGAALIGTPHGSGIAWLLENHKVQFGQRTIASVRVWSTAKDRFQSFNAIFKIVPVSETVGSPICICSCRYN